MCKTVQLCHHLHALQSAYVCYIQRVIVEDLLNGPYIAGRARSTLQPPYNHLEKLSMQLCNFLLILQEPFP